MRQQRNSRWVLLGCCGFIGLLWSVAAQAQVVTVIQPTPPTGTVTVSLFQLDASGAYVDVTGSYLPRVGEVVYVKMSNNATPVLVPHSNTAIPALNTLTFPFNAAAVALLNPYLTEVTTSAYQGEATNYPSTPSNVAPPGRTDDFNNLPGMTTLPDSSTAYGFTALDYGGMLVVQAGGVKFIIPKDSNSNAIPDSWEAQYGGSLVREADIDPGPGGNAAMGDGFSNFDEYRGFVVSGQHVRTDPRVKNLFVHLVNPQLQCGTGSASSYLGGGTTTIAAPDILFTNLNTLITGANVSALGVTAGVSAVNTNEWVDHFVSYSESTKTNTYLSGTDGTTSDRRVNLNAVYPLKDSVTLTYFQKGLRITECLDSTMPADLALTVMGSAGLGTANGPDNALIYTQRIINWVHTKLNGTPPKVSTYVNGAWTSPALTTNGEFDIYQKMIQYVVAMEIGHSVKLTPTIEGTRNTSYGYHHAPGTGTDMDVQANFKSPTFSIPSLFSATDQTNFKVRNN